jgi:mannose-6-phosphate isomerase
MLPLLTFEPILKERIWGGRRLQSLYAKPLPPHLPIGEAWEISDRPGDESVVDDGPCQGQTLRQIVEKHADDLFGPLKPMPKRFPLLIKIIDACATLSLQVHPPAELAAALGGEPKTEIWYIAQAGPAAELFVGLKHGVTRAEFEKKLAGGTVADCFHRIPVRAGDAMFLPSGRVHALGADIMIFEIQQNSDTTYRVFDWNRVDASGKPRQLHIEESLKSIDFNDFHPSLLPKQTTPGHPGTIRPLVNCNHFQVSLRRMRADESLSLPGGHLRILGVVEGALHISEQDQSVRRTAGGFCLIPACATATIVRAEEDVAFLQIGLG